MTTHGSNCLCDGDFLCRRTEEADKLIVPAVELRAWARASQLLAEREGFARTAKAIQLYIDDIETRMHDGAYSFELKSVSPKEN